MKTQLIYCAGSNREYAAWALESGHSYGARLPDLVYFHPEFVDQDWERPNKGAYLAALREHKPRLASVLDWERPEQTQEVLEWAESASQYAAEAVIIIPKWDGAIALLSEVLGSGRRIGGKPVRLGYSVPTSYAGTEVMMLEFCGWPVHLLGGSPKNQMKLARWLDVRSADGNYIHHKVRFGQFFDGRRWLQLRDGGYPDIMGAQIPEYVIKLSLPNITRAWASLC